MALVGQTENSNGEFSKQLERFRSGLQDSEDYEKEFHRLSKIINSFFAAKYNVHYKFTYEDLKFELKEKGIDDDWEKIERLCDGMDKLEFEKDKINKTTLLKMVTNFSEFLGSGNIVTMPKPPQLDEKKEMSYLPKFEEMPMKQRVSNVMKQLKKNKRELESGIETIEEEEKVLKKEKKFMKSKKRLPEFKIFNKSLEDEIEELEKKKAVLKKKEELINRHLEELTGVQNQLIEQSEKIKKGHKSLKKREDYVETKEKVISEIKKDLEEKYQKTVEEIENLKKDLKEKRKSFTKLQDFYQNREKKLALEEENLLNEKRRYARTVSNLIEEHMNMARQDIELTDKKIEEIKQRFEEIEKKEEEYKEKHKQISKRKVALEEAIESKKKFFTELEQEIKSNDSEYEILKKSIDKKKDSILRLEKRLDIFEEGLEDLRQRARSKKQELDLRELDVKRLENEVNRLRTSIKSSNRHLKIREKELRKRKESYKEIKSKIDKDIAREKRAVKRMEKKLRKEGAPVSKELKKFNIVDDYYEKAKKVALEMEHQPSKQKDRVEKEVTITHEFPKKEIGNPDVLEVLELLERAKAIINQNKAEEAKGIYLEIQKLFDNLDEQMRNILYDKMTRIFSSLRSGNMTEEDIDSLITKFRNSVNKGDMRTTATLYPKIQNKYASLPQEEKGKYYSQIVELGQRIS